MVRLEHGVDLSGKNTFGMKVSCAAYVEYSSSAELQALNFDSLPKPLLHIGCGSNLLFTGDFPGTVLHSAIKYVKYVDMGLDEVLLTVGSGVILDELARETCGYGLWGLENLSLIPGEVGAAAVQNVGAYGAEIKDVISGVVCFDTEARRKVIFKVGECGYAYRDSRFKHEKRFIVTSVLLRLTRKYSPNLSYKGLDEAFAGRTDVTPGEVREAVIRIRRSKLPDPVEVGSAGSFFRNPVLSASQFAQMCSGYETVPHYILEGGFVKVPAAWLIEQSGMKGAAVGGAVVYEKQPLVIVNADGRATPSDVLALEAEIQEKVRNKFGVELQPEVEHI